MKNKILKLSIALMVTALLAAAVFAVQSAVRIRFARGASSAAVKGTVGKYGKQDYIIGAKKSQTLSTSVNSGCGSVTLDVLYRETGESLTDEPATSFENTLVSAGDYIISVQNSDLPSCKFTLSVAIE